METIDTKLVNFFNSYLFRNVWNEPSKEYRRNIKPLLISNPVSNTAIKLDWKRYSLPTAEKYQVYFIPESTMSGITFKEFDDWTTSVDFLNSTRVELRFHNNDGVMLPREKVFVTSHPEKPGVLIAIKRETFRTFYGAAASYDDLFMAFYYDSDLTNDVTITTYTMNGGTDANVVFAAAQAATSVYVNGIATKVSVIGDISIADAIVEIVKDDNVLGEFELDLTDTDQQRNFISTLDGHSKTIVHIPKSLNPDNRIISHNTCDIWIYPRNGISAHKNGRFLHRAIESYTFTQVTHNDFAIPDAIINTYANVLNTTEFKIVVQIKNHTKDNYLITDKNYIGLLYTHDDNTILDFFEGVGPEEFDFWKADVLEASEYVKMIVDTPNFVDVSNLPLYIGALGYYNSIALISNRIKTIVLEELEGVVSHTFIVPVPIVFESIKVFPSVFINGLKLDQNLLTIGPIASGSLAIIIDESVVLADGDVAKVELFEDVPHGIVEVRPTSTYAHIDVPDDDFVLYEIIDNPAQPAPAIEGSYPKVYLRLDDYSTVGSYVDSVSGRYIAFNPSSYGRKFIVAHNRGFEYKSYLIDSMLSSNAPLSFDLETTIRSIDFEPPYVWEDHVAKSSTSGDVYDPLDENAENEFPAWNLMDGDETWDVSKRWITTLRPEGNRAIFDLAPAHQNTYWLIGYRIGALPNPNDALRASQLPINWQIEVDGVEVDTVQNEWWYLNPEPIHTHILSSPVLVDSRIEFSLNGVQTNGAFTIQTDMFEPIFSDASEITSVVYLGDIRCIPYLNGKELVKDIDYLLADFQNPGYSGSPHVAGRQLIVNNAAYLEESDNKLEIIICHNEPDAEVQDFLKDSYIGGVNSTPRWYDQLSMIAADGLIEENVSESFGSVEVNLGIDCSLGLIDCDLNGGINPHTGQLWKVGDTYRMAFVSSTVMDATSINIEDYNAHVQAAAATAGLGDITWKAFVSTPTVAAKDNTLMSPTDVDSALFAMVGNEVIGNDIADLFDGEVTNKIEYTEDGSNISTLPIIGPYPGFTSVWTGCNIYGNPRVGNEVGQASVSFGICGAEKLYQWFRDVENTPTVETRVLAISEPLTLTAAIRFGAPAGIRTLVPEKSKYFIDRYYADDDTPTLDALTLYFRGLVDDSEPTVYIPYSHRIVSIRAHIIIKDMIDGNIVIPFDPDDNEVLQLLTDYDYLKQYDVALLEDSSVDLDYVDIQAMYTDQDISDTVLLKQINRVIEVLYNDVVNWLRPDHEG